MIIYNVTVKVDPEIESEWLTWMKEHHIPDVMKTGCFTAYAINKLKYPVEDEGSTYAFQYSCKTMEDLERYHSNFARKLQKDHTDRYANRFVAFRTILEQLDAGQ